MYRIYVRLQIKETATKQVVSLVSLCVTYTCSRSEAVRAG